MLHYGERSDGWVVDLDPLDLVVLVVHLLQEVVRNVRHEHACVRLACQVDIVSVHVEGVNEVLPESGELGRHVVLALDEFPSAWLS